MVLSGLGRAGAECPQCPGPGREGCVPAYRLWGQNPAQAASNCRESSEASSHNASAYGLPALHAVLTESWGSGGGGGGSERLQGTPTVCPALGFSPLMVSRVCGGDISAGRALRKGLSLPRVLGMPHLARLEGCSEQSAYELG